MNYELVMKYLKGDGINVTSRTELIDLLLVCDMLDLTWRNYAKATYYMPSVENIYIVVEHGYVCYGRMDNMLDDFHMPERWDNVKREATRCSSPLFSY